MKAIYLILGLLLPYLAFGQDSTQLNDSLYTQRDLGDVIRKALKKPAKISEDFDDTPGDLLLIPTIGSNPAIGFMIGVGGQYAFKLSGEETSYSIFSGSVQFTTKDQQLFLLKNNIYTKNNKFFLSGDWRYQIFSQSTYGLGTNAPENGILDFQFGLGGHETDIDTLAQPLKFDFIRLHQSASYNIAGSFYIGIGYYLDSYSKIVDEKLNLNPGDTLITSHYAYSKHYGFNENKYVSSALGINLVYDTRDNMINAYSGYFAMLGWNSALEFLGSDKSANYLSLEWRSFHPLSQKNPRHLISFWAMGEFTTEGKVPYLILPATAYDQRSRSGRGYAQGRFRGNQMAYGEAEYRFPISQCGGLWGGVVFANATTANNPIQTLNLFESIKPGYGFGARLMVDKKSRTNLAMDFAFGEKTFGFYLAASETF